MYFLNTTTVCNRAPPHPRGTLIFDNVMVRCVCVCTGTVCDVPHVSMSSNGLLVQGHGCACTRAPAAITHFTVHLWNGSSSHLPGQVRGRKWAGRKGGSRSSALWLQVVTLNLGLRPHPPSVWQYALWQNTDVQTQCRCLQFAHIEGTSFLILP